MKMQKSSHDRVRWLCVCAMLMAVNIVMSSFSVPVPGGHLYLNDIIIDTAALLLDPLGAFLVGGVGAFLGDFFFYPTPMFVSLVTRGAQAAVIALLMRRHTKKEELASVPVLAVGALIGNPKIKAKMGNKMTEGMLMPYKKLLNNVQKKK